MFEVGQLVELPSTDLAYQVFAFVFGQGWNDVAEGGSKVLSGPLVDMCEYLNSVMLSICSVYCLGAFITGAVGTASSGKPGGQQSLTWWPLRSVMGIGMTAPIVKGVSGIQILVLCLVSWSCSFANTLYVSQLDALAESGFSYRTSIKNPAIEQEAFDIAQLLLKASYTQQYYIKHVREMSESVEKYGGERKTFATIKEIFYENEYVDGLISDYYLFKFTPPPTAGLKPDDMGYIRISGKKDDPLLIAKVRAVYEMTKVIRDGVSLYQDGKPRGDFISHAMSIYINAYQNVQTNFIHLYPDLDITRQIHDLKQKAAESGWMSAGAYPLMMSSLSRQVSEILTKEAEVVQPNMQKLSFLNEQTYKKYFTGMYVLLNEAAAQPAPFAKKRTLNETTATVVETHLIEIGWLLPSLLDRFENEDPILVIGDAGQFIVNSAAAIWGTAFVIEGTKNLMTGVADSLSFVPGVGAVGKVIDGASQYVLSPLKFLAAALFGIGLIFAYVFPALPLLYWLFAMAQYVLLILETFIAVPFWMAAHVWGTEGRGMAGERGGAGYFLLIEILFRPVLYVAGFWMIFYATKGIAWLTSQLFKNYYYAYSNSDIATFAPLTAVMMLLLIIFLFLIMYSYLCTEGYSHLPRNVMKWIGQSASNAGIAERASGTKGAVVAAINRKSGGVIGGSVAKSVTKATKIPPPSSQPVAGTGGSGAGIQS